MTNEPASGDVPIYDDEVIRPRRRKVEEAEMDITPMIDITFLLLIFFLVASKMDADTGVDLPSARYGTAVSARNSVILTVAPGDGNSAKFYKGDGTSPENLISAADMTDLEDQITQYVESVMHGTPPKDTVLIKGAATVRQREIARVERAVGRVISGQPLHIAVLED
jgi:biopolymer transport protein ExbD